METTGFEERPVQESNGNGTVVARERGERERRVLPPRRPSPPPAIIDVEAALKEQLQDERTTALRADMGEQYVENLELPRRGDLWIPGHRTITPALAREFGLKSAFTDDPFEDLPLDEPQPQSAAVDGNTIATFIDGVTGQQKIDVLNSCLLAQLAANVKFDPQQAPVEWTKYYRGVLENIGWVIPQFTFRQLTTSQARFTMDAVILKLITGLLTDNEIEAVKATIEALKNLDAGDGRIRIFSQNSTENRVGNFQLDTVGVSAQGTISMKLTAYGFQTNEQVTNVLWFSFGGASTKLQVTRSTLVLNEQVFERLRDPIVTKLGNRAQDYIRGLEI